MAFDSETFCHLRNKDANRTLHVSWNDVDLEHYKEPIYLGLTLGRSLSLKAHVEKLRDKVSSRNNLLHKFKISSWGAKPSMLHITAPTL